MPKGNHMAQADKLFSQMIRMRDQRCVSCSSPDRLQCAHIISRSYKAIRVDPDNAIALCQSCHVRFTHRPLEWRDFIDEMWPGRWDRLRKRALTYERVDWKRKLVWLRSVVGSTK
jgi:5-methylcytosine-specific restriction endonuclease McrA